MPRWSLGSPGDQLRSHRAEWQNWDANPRGSTFIQEVRHFPAPRGSPHPSPGLPQNQPSGHLHPPPSCSPGTLSGREGGGARGGPRPSAADSPRLPSFFARPVPAAKKPGPPSGAVTKGAAIPTITRVPAMRVRDSPRGQEGPSAPAPPCPLLSPGPAAGAQNGRPHGPEGSGSPKPHGAGMEPQAPR